MAPSLQQVQHTIVDEFTLIGDDRETALLYLMELGEQLPPLEDEHKHEQNTIKGCQSKVWLVTDFKQGKVHFRADSNTAITKGLISLLIRTFSERTPEEILQAELFFPEQIGLHHLIGSQRSNGLAAMIRQMKYYALAYRAT